MSHLLKISPEWVISIAFVQKLFYIFFGSSPTVVPSYFSRRVRNVDLSRRTTRPEAQRTALILWTPHSIFYVGRTRPQRTWKRAKRRRTSSPPTPQAVRSRRNLKLRMGRGRRGDLSRVPLPCCVRFMRLLRPTTMSTLM